MYDEFLAAYFKLFGGEDDTDIDLVPFLREWQRKKIVWGGAPVLVAYMAWAQHLKKGSQTHKPFF